MSQAGKVLLSAPIPGEVGTLTGNSGGAVGPDGMGNINVVGDGTINIVGSPGTHTLTASAGHVEIGQTIGAATLDLDTIAIPNNSISFLNIEVIGAYPIADAAAIGGNFQCIALNNAGTVSFIQNSIIPLTEFQTVGTTASIAIVASGADAVIQVTGQALKTINWKSVTSVLNQATP
jgi:hypothetical protein